MLQSPTPIYHCIKSIALAVILYLSASTTVFAQATGWWVYGVFVCPACVNSVVYAQETIAKLTWNKAQAELEAKLKEELQKKATEISSAATAKLNTQIQTSLGDALKGPVGQMLKQSGVDLNKIVGTVGHIDPAAVQNRITKFTQATNLIELNAAIAADAAASQLQDRINVYSMLDEKPISGRCTSTTAEKCTILTVLREQDAIALDALQRQNVASVAAQVAQKGQWGDTMLAQVDRLAGKTDLNVLAFLTASPSLPLGFEPNDQTAPTLEKAMWLSQILVGTKNDTQFLTRSAQDSRGTNDSGQIDAMSKIGRVQLARSAILNVQNQHINASLNSQFRACVVRPDAQDRVGATQEQQLVHIQSLLRCRNMMLLQLRQQKMEKQRLQGAMLLALLDLYAVQGSTPRNK